MTQKTRRYGSARAGAGLAASLLMLVLASGVGVVAFAQQSPAELATEPAADAAGVFHPSGNLPGPMTYTVEPDGEPNTPPQELHRQEDYPQEPYRIHMLDAPPKLMNVADAKIRMRSLYPRTLLDAGLPGKVLVKLVIRPDGSVAPESIAVEESTRADFDGPSVRLVEQFRFEPGKVDGVAVHTVVWIPIAWDPEEM